MTKFTHFDFFSFLRKYWFLILATAIIAFNVGYCIYKICYSAEILHQADELLSECQKYHEENPNFFTDVEFKNLTSMIIDSKDKTTLCIVLDSISILVSVLLLTFLYLIQFFNRKINIKKLLFIITTIFVLFTGSWLLYSIVTCVSELITSYSSITITNETIMQVLLPRVILDTIELVLNICLSVIIYIYYIHGNKQKVQIN